MHESGTETSTQLERSKKKAEPELGSELAILQERYEKLRHKDLAHLQLLENYKKALDLHSLVAITDPRGQILSVNEKFCKVSGYSQSELIGQHHSIVNSGHHGQEFFRRLWATLKRGDVWKGEICNRAKSGRLYWVKTTIVPFFGKEGEVTQYMAIRTDITDKKVTQHKLSELNEKLVRSRQRLEAEHLAVNRKNDALRELISHVEDEKVRIRSQILRDVDLLVLPLIEQLEPRISGVEQKYLELIARSLSDILDPLRKSQSFRLSSLTAKEKQICNMIRHGLTAKDAARLLHLSHRTVEKHKENIRKKLGVGRQSLANYLSAIL